MQNLIMRHFVSGIVCCAALFFLIQSVPAFTVGSVAVAPPGVQNPGDVVNVSFIVYAASGTAFATYDDLQFVTELDDPAWTYSISVNGVANSRPVIGGRTLTISGFELGYRNQDEVIVRTSLGGIVPSGSVTGANKTLVKIQELDARGNVIPYSVVQVEHLIGQPTPPPTPSYGRILVTSVPTGGNVYIDNAYRGLTPVTLNDIPNGNHILLLKLDGYQDFSQTLIIRGDDRTVNASLSLKPSEPVTTSVAAVTSSIAGPTMQSTSTQTPGYGSLSVTTSPAGALVYIDGVMKGVTPTTIPMVPEGPHSVVLVMGGYQDLKTTITVNAGTTSEYITGLQKSTKAPGFVVISCLIAFGVCILFRKGAT
jgi:hypothetical protein